MDSKYELIVRVEIRDARVSGGGLSVQEGGQVSCETFLDIAKILGQFHELTEAIKQGHAVKK